MNDFMIDCQQIRQDAASVRSLAASVQFYPMQIKTTAMALALNGVYSVQVKRALHDISEQVEMEHRYLKSLGAALEDISQTYVTAEQKIAEAVAESTSGSGISPGGMTAEERTLYDKYRREVDELTEILSGRRGVKECLQKWYDLLKRGSFNDPKNYTLTKAEKEAILRFLSPGLDGTTDGYNTLTSKIPGLANLFGKFAPFLNSGTANQIEKGTIGILTMNGLLQSLLGFNYREGSDSYYTEEGSLQNQWGFNDAMDHWGSTLGMNLDTSISTFTYDGQEFRVQFWKGTYGWDSCVGGEFGIYSRPEWEAKGNPYVEGSPESRMILYEAVEDRYQVPVRQTTTYTRDSGREKSFVNDTSTYGDGDHYWNLNIRSDAGVDKQSVRSEYVIDCSKQGSGFCDAMYNSLKDKPDLQVSRNGNTITVKY